MSDIQNNTNEMAIESKITLAGSQHKQTTNQATIQAGRQPANQPPIQNNNLTKHLFIQTSLARPKNNSVHQSVSQSFIQ